MITTNVDRTIELLHKKGEIDTGAIAKSLGAPKENIELILTFLEEMGMVELKYGVTKTIASMKKYEEKKKEEAEKAEEEEKEEKEKEAKEEAEERKKEEAKKPHPPKMPAAALFGAKGKAATAVPERQLKAMVPAFRESIVIPRLDEKKFPENDKTIARITNMKINLLERFYRLPPDKRANAVIVMNDIMKLAKENNIYRRKDPLSMEFILCSLLISLGVLIGEYEENKSFAMAKKIHSTYHIMRDVALKIEKPRLGNYETLIRDVYERVINDIYPNSMVQAK